MEVKDVLKVAKEKELLSNKIAELQDLVRTMVFEGFTEEEYEALKQDIENLNKHLEILGDIANEDPVAESRKPDAEPDPQLPRPVPERQQPQKPQEPSPAGRDTAFRDKGPPAANTGAVHKQIPAKPPAKK